MGNVDRVTCARDFDFVALARAAYQRSSSGLIMRSLPATNIQGRKSLSVTPKLPFGTSWVQRGSQDDAILESF